MTLKHSIERAKRNMVQGRDVPWLLDQWVQKTPDKPFLIWEPFDGEPCVLSYAQFSQRVKALAGNLHERGVAFGERVLVHLDNSPEFIISWFACAELGAVVVSTNTRSVARDMNYFAEHAEVVAAITQPGHAQLVADCTRDLKCLVVTCHDAGTPSKVSESIDYLPFDELICGTQQPPARPTDHMADLGIQFTSGTTSRPKAVLWTHANAIWGAQQNANHLRLVHEDITLTFLPLFHTNAQSYSMLGMLWVGGTLVLQPRFSASRFWEVSIRHACTFCSMIPFCIKALASHPPPTEHFYQRWLTAVHLPEADESFGVRTFGLWGMTETITQGIVADPDHPGPRMSIGRPSPGYEISIRHAHGDKRGCEVAAGERGRLYIRGVPGVTLFKEYYRNPEATRESFDEEGWFDTGDVVRVGEEGDLFFSDRDKDMLKVGAENVAASEIEAVILETGWIDECAVVGQKHPMLDEVPVAFVIPNATAPDDLKRRLIEVCGTSLADFKVIRDVHIIDEMPRSTLEKVAKNVLRARLPEFQE